MMPVRKRSLNQSGSVLILTMVIAGLMSFIVFSMLNVRNHHLKQMSSIKQKLAAHLIMEAVGQRMKSAYDMYLPYEEGTTPPADACYGGEWQNITFFKSDVTAAQESAYFCFPKNGEICVQNPFNKNDTEACFSLQNFQNSGVAQVDGFKNQIAQNPQLNILKPNIDVAKTWNISADQLQKWQTARLPVILQIGGGAFANAGSSDGDSIIGLHLNRADSLQPTSTVLLPKNAESGASTVIESAQPIMQNQNLVNDQPTSSFVGATGAGSSDQDRPVRNLTVKTIESERRKRTEVPQSWLAAPSNAPSVPNTAEVSKENIDMTCTGMNKCVKFTACLSKNCDSSKQVSQLFAFKSPKAKTVFPIAKNNVTKPPVNPTDELCWSAPETDQLGVQCTLTGSCTTEGADGGECIAGEAENDGMNRLIDKDLHPNRPMFEGRTKPNFRSRVSIGKAQCVRKPAGSCSSGSYVNLPPKCYTEFKLPESVKCRKTYAETGLMPDKCEINFNLSELNGFAEAAKTSELFDVSYRSGDLNQMWGHRCKPVRDYVKDLKNGEWYGATLMKGTGRTFDEKIAKASDSAVVIQDGALTIRDHFRTSYGNSVYPCISDITVVAKNTSDPTCKFETIDPGKPEPDTGYKPLD